MASSEQEILEGLAEIVNEETGLDPAEVFRTSGAELAPGGDGVSAEVRLAEYAKCARSWRRVPDDGSDPAYPDLSARDAEAERYRDQTHA